MYFFYKHAKRITFCKYKYDNAHYFLFHSYDLAHKNNSTFAK